MLNEEEKKILVRAFNLAIKASDDALAAASVLLPLLQKITTEKPAE
jgi:hypothetical protein